VEISVDKPWNCHIMLEFCFQKYIEQERDKLSAKVSSLEEQLAAAQTRYNNILEEKARLSEQAAQELFLVKNDCSKWRNL